MGVSVEIVVSAEDVLSMETSVGGYVLIGPRGGGWVLTFENRLVAEQFARTLLREVETP